MTDPSNPVTIVGAGMAGAACAAALKSRDVPVRIVDRGRAPGGRMASPTLRDRRVDTGAGYFTVRDDGFTDLVERWSRAGIAREWTDTFGVLSPDSDPDTKTGPMRWGTPAGLRSLVRAVLDDARVEVESVAVDELPGGDVVIAMPDPQASRLLTVPDAVDYDPVITVVCGFAERTWPFEDAAFVNDHPDIEFVADDGARRGDGSAVLVTHTTADRARRHLDNPDGALDPVVAALRDVAHTGEPLWTHVHRWTYAKPAGKHDAFFGSIGDQGRIVGLAGDQWCPNGSPRIESAWKSGTELGYSIAAERLRR